MKRWDEPHTYTVEGKGEFPWDMLRRDQAYPTHSEDAMKLNQEGKRRITLTAATMRHIAIERWLSFGWKVVDGFDEHRYPTELHQTIPA